MFRATFVYVSSRFYVHYVFWIFIATFLACTVRTWCTIFCRRTRT